MKRFELVGAPLGFHSVELDPSHARKTLFNTAAGTAMLEMSDGAKAKFFDNGEYKDDGLERSPEQIEIVARASDLRIK